MGKSSKSVSMEDQLKKIIEEMPGSDSGIVNDALRRYLVTDTEVLQDKIEDLESQREQLRLEKQRIEKNIWDMDDQIEDLKDKMTRAKAVEDTREAIGMDQIEDIAQIVRENKYDSDPRSDSENTVLEKHAEIIVEENPDLDKEKVLETLRIYVNV